MSRRNVALYVSGALLTILGLTYLANGVLALVSPTFSGDLKLRWREQRYVLQGINPYDVSSQFLDRPQSADEASRCLKHNLQSEERVKPSGYPPWAFFSGFLFVFPTPYRLTQWTYCGFNCIGLAITLGWVFRRARPLGKAEALFLTGAVFAMFGHASTLRLGQYGILMNAALVVALIGEERGWWSWLGLGFSLATTKPNLSLFFFPLLFARQRWRALAATATYCALGSLVVWRLVGVDPVEMTRQMLSQSATTTGGDVGLLGMTVSLGVPYRMAVLSLALGGSLLALGVTWAYRLAPPLAIFAAASVLGRLFLYHRQYDNVMLLFLLVALGLVALRNGRLSTWIVFLVVGLSLWLPLRRMDYTLPVTIVLTSTWLVGLATVLCHCDRLAIPSLLSQNDSLTRPITGFR